MVGTLRTMLACVVCLVASFSARAEYITRIWLTHARSDTSFLTVNWETDQPGPSRVDYGASASLGATSSADAAVTLHHMEIPFPVDGELHYRVSTGNRCSAIHPVKSYSGERLRIAAVANWQERPSLDALLNEDPHLLLSCGDMLPGTAALERPGDTMNTAPFSRLIDTYPALFARVPFMPVPGNHDRQIYYRLLQPSATPIYDLDATAFRSFFPLPKPGWNWNLDLPAYDVRLIALDLSHTPDVGTTRQSCRDFDVDSAQLKWFRETMDASQNRHVITLYNEWHHLVNKIADGSWMPHIQKGSAAISGFGLFAERAIYDGLPCFNTSLKTGSIFGNGRRTQFYQKVPAYLVLSFPRGGGPMGAAFKGLDGKMINRTEWPGRE